jgi:hypothetical protein
MLHRFIYILIILCKNFSLFGQEYSYQHYDLTNGLSGLTVYSITQDKKIIYGLELKQVSADLMAVTLKTLQLRMDYLIMRC